MESKKKFVLIGAGLPRTGTSSLRDALEQILGGKCYHMSRFSRSKGKDDANFFLDALDGKATKQDWEKFASRAEIVASVDYPSSYFYKEMMEAFPDAKVLLSVRDPESWYKSFSETILQLRDLKTTWPFNWVEYARIGCKKSKVINGVLNGISEGCESSVGDAVRKGKESGVAYYTNWVNDVKQNVPREKLFIHSAKDGWEPLCNFLGVPIPDNPYPRRNDTKEMQNDYDWHVRVTYLIASGFILFLALMIYSVWLLF